jgi:hypothetical protein
VLYNELKNHVILLDFLELHEKQSGWMFSILFAPPLEIGIMWSLVIEDFLPGGGEISSQDLLHPGQVG